MNVVLADGKRTTSYIISACIYLSWCKAGAHKAIPPIHAKDRQHIKVISSRRLQPNNTEPSEQKPEKVQHTKLNTKRRDKTKNSVPLARACHTPNPRENEQNPATKTNTSHQRAPALGPVLIRFSERDTSYLLCRVQVARVRFVFEYTNRNSRRREG